MAIKYPKIINSKEGNMANFIKEIVLWLDQGLSVLTGGYADETLSARAYRRKWVLGQKLINMLFFWQVNHCKTAYENEIFRRHMPMEYR